MNVKLKPWRLITAIMVIIVTTMLTVPILRDHFTARVFMATQEMVLFVQVKNVINLGKFNDEWYTSNGFSRLQLMNNKSSSRMIALAHTRQTKTSISSTIYKHYTATVVEQPCGSLGKTMILVFPIIILLMKDTIISSYLMKWYNYQRLDNRKVNIGLADDPGSDPFPKATKQL